MSREISCSTSVKTQDNETKPAYEKSKYHIRRDPVLACLLWPPQRAQAVVPAPDDGYAGGSTAEGHAALFSPTGSSYSTAIGLFSLSSDTGGNFDTAIGAGALLTNTSVKNTATGVGVPLSDIIVSLLILPWLVRALASAKAIWQALTDGQKSDRKKERCALADS
jgi:hypothetical protein